MDSDSIYKKNFINYVDHIIENQRLSHAYLIEIGNYESDFSYVLDFVKMILSNLSYQKVKESIDSELSLVDSFNHPDVRIVEPEGNVIKKAQLLDIQKEYSNKSLLNGKRIYIIKNAEKLNGSSANTMLKFLEEPEDDIVAILLTDNRYHVLETILSRCQILTLKDDAISFENIDIIELLKCVVIPSGFFLKYNYFLENIVPEKEIMKEKLLEIEEILIQYLNEKNGLSFSLNEEILTVLKPIDDKKILNYLSIMEDEIPKLDFNVNYKLWVDSFFAKMIIGG